MSKITTYCINMREKKVGGGGEEAGSRDVAFHANVRFNKQEGQAEI